MDPRRVSINFFEHCTDFKVDLYPAISKFFQRHLNAASLMVDEISGPLASAVELATAAILEDQNCSALGWGLTVQALPRLRV